MSEHEKKDENKTGHHESKSDAHKHEGHEHKGHEHKSHKKHDHKSHKSKHSTHHHGKRKQHSKTWIITSGVLFVLLIVSIFTQGFTVDNSSYDLLLDQVETMKEKVDSPAEKQKLKEAGLLINEAKTTKISPDNTEGNENTKDSEQENPAEETGSGESQTESLSLTVISDKLCTDCEQKISKVTESIKKFFPEVSDVNQLDYEQEKAKSLMKEMELQMLPAYILGPGLDETKAWSSNKQLAQTFDKKGDKYVIKARAVGSTHDPMAEICDNGKDDRDADSDADCADSECQDSWVCMEKQDTPEVELFVMSHCPYGTQMEKAMLPVADLLQDEIDYELKFCDYAMHGKKELDEQLRQHCIQKNEEAKFNEYLTCFLNSSDSEQCLEKANIDQSQLEECVAATDEEYKVTEMFENKSTWRSGRFPVFNLYQEEVQEYGVRGSPTLVINGVTAQAGRTPQAILNAVCRGFEEKPEECDKSLSSAAPSPGFGFKETSASASTSGAQCS